MERCFVDPRPQAAETLRRAMNETFALGFPDVSRSLETLLARFNAAPVADLRIEICSGNVSVNGLPVRLSNRELELCFALAVHLRPMPGEMLAEVIYPELELEAALNRIKVYVHRVREKIAPDFIICDRDGYRFRDGLTIDLSEIEEQVRLLERRAFLVEQDRETLMAIIERLLGRRNAPVWRWEWFAIVEQRFVCIASRAAAVLSADAFERNATGDLLELSRCMLAYDPCNEQAREIAIKAHLAAGRLSDAVVEFKSYEAAMARDLCAQPSAHLRELLQIH
ncbi:MAG: hypothetical protein NVSMB31_12450 [Vulcanimicrobiaceae bacterium]